MKKYLTPAIAVYLLVYILLISFSLGIFRLFKPYPFIENNSSHVACNSGGSFEIGPNSIFALGLQLDKINDVKARKLCQYQIIRDYGNTYATPPDINYKFLPDVKQDSDWSTALLAMSSFFLFGSFCTESVTSLIFKNRGFNIGIVIRNFLLDLIS